MIGELRVTSSGFIRVVPIHNLKHDIIAISEGNECDVVSRAFLQTELKNLLYKFVELV